jgi:hypothetical protein
MTTENSQKLKMQGFDERDASLWIRGKSQREGYALVRDETALSDKSQHRPPVKQ